MLSNSSQPNLNQKNRKTHEITRFIDQKIARINNKRKTNNESIVQNSNSKYRCFKISHLLPNLQSNQNKTIRNTINRSVQYIQTNLNDQRNNYRNPTFFRQTHNKIELNQVVNKIKWVQNQISDYCSLRKNISQQKTALNSLQTSFHKTCASSKKIIPLDLSQIGQKKRPKINKCSIFNKQNIFNQCSFAKEEQSDNYSAKNQKHFKNFIPKMFPTHVIKHLKYSKMAVFEQIPKDKESLAQILQKQQLKTHQYGIQDTINQKAFYCKYNQSRVREQDIRNYKRRRQETLSCLKQKDLYQKLCKKLGIKKEKSLLLKLNLPMLESKFQYTRFRLHQLFSNYNTLMQFCQEKVTSFIQGFNTFLHINQMSIKFWYIDQLVQSVVRTKKSEMFEKYFNQPQRRKVLQKQISPEIISFQTFVELFNQCQVLLDKQAVMQYLDNFFDTQKAQKQLISYEQIIQQLSKKYQLSKCVKIADLIKQKTQLNRGGKIFRKSISFLSYIEKQVFFMARQLYQHQILLQKTQRKSKQQKAGII